MSLTQCGWFSRLESNHPSHWSVIVNSVQPIEEKRALELRLQEQRLERECETRKIEKLKQRLQFLTKMKLARAS